MPTTAQRYVISSVTTFAATFFGTLLLEVQASGSVDLTTSFVLGISGVALRAAVKAVIEYLAGVSGDAASTRPGQ